MKEIPSVRSPDAIMKSGLSILGTILTNSRKFLFLSKNCLNFVR